MKDKRKNNDPERKREVNSHLSLEEEIIEALKKKNEQIASGEEQPDDNVNKGKTSGGFDEWSVSWP